MMRTRCFVCAARAFQPAERTLLDASGRRHAFAFACGSCGALISDDANPASCAADLARRLSSPAFHPDDLAEYGLDPFSLRIAATAKRLGIRPIGEAQLDGLRRPHSPLTAEAELFALDGAPQTPVSLGICCRTGELDAVLATLGDHAGWAREVVILVDAEVSDAVPCEVDGFDEGAVRIAGRPLGGDFAAQRNALAALSTSAWMLQLDADEALEPETGELLPALALDAERQGVVSIGFRRRNLVDGALSDLFPDTQYRLNHASVAYAGVVHERPGVDWWHSTITLHGAIVHHLARGHVETRSQRYEHMLPGQGRLEEQERLLSPYRA
jgi:hypothetical protein